MADPITPLDSPVNDDPEPLQELHRRDEEILRLRDLLIGKDAELGSLKGHVAQLEAGTARLLSLVARVRSLLPGFVWSTLAALRRRRGPQG
jgi:hypothetical protein